MQCILALPASIHQDISLFGVESRCMEFSVRCWILDIILGVVSVSLLLLHNSLHTTARHVLKPDLGFYYVSGQEYVAICMHEKLCIRPPIPERVCNPLTPNDLADFGGPVVVCDDVQTMAFNKAVLHYMTHEPLVERYAAFGTFTSWAS